MAHNRRSGNIVSVVVGEIQTIITVMRRNRKWQTNQAAFSFNQNEKTLFAFQQCRRTAQQNGASDPVALVAPFIDVICSADVSGQITELALSSLLKLLSTGLLDGGSLGCVKATTMVVNAIFNCRFDPTDSSGDEVVLRRLLQLSEACISRPEAGQYLTDRAVWNLFRACVRIKRQLKPPAYSAVLCDEAEFTVLSIIRTIFERLRGDVSTIQPLQPLQPTNSDSTIRRMSLSAEVPLGSEPPLEGGSGYGLRVIIKVFEFVCGLAAAVHAPDVDDSSDKSAFGSLSHALSFQSEGAGLPDRPSTGEMPDSPPLSPRSDDGLGHWAPDEVMGNVNSDSLLA